MMTKAIPVMSDVFSVPVWHEIGTGSYGEHVEHGDEDQGETEGGRCEPDGDKNDQDISTEKDA